jgi:hypothetical protein
MYHKRTYQTWYHMNGRCHKPRSRSYKHYGARGIRVCIRWRCSYEKFYEDMGEHPGDGYSIDRIDNDGNYTPKNCRWATKKEQYANKTNNVFLTYKGETKHMAEWARITGINKSTIKTRRRRGKSICQILSKT